MSVKENNKRIAKNTILLYIRMFAVMAVTLYTSRVVLDVLGSEDYGINNVVGGIVAMLSFMSNTMTHSAQRFFSIELGKGNFEKLKRIFQVNLSIYLAIALLVIVLGETVGLWFMHSYMVIPAERMVAADWVLHFAILTFCLSMLVLPFKAAIMARENMSIMAYLSIVEVVAKLGLVFLLLVFSFDKLILFSILNFVVMLVVSVFYVVFAHRKYTECTLKLTYDKDIFMAVMSFTGWSILGHFAMIARSQGINILLNIYCGPVVNAARAIAFQVNTAVSQFYTNFFMAVKPQIIKYYSVEDKENMYNLVARSSKLCYFLVFIFALPLLLETDFVLGVWLKEVPAYTSIFVKLILVNTLIEAIMPGLTTSIDATGRIRNFQIIVTFILLLNIPFSWWLLKNGYNPYTTFVIVIIMSVFRLILQFIVVGRLLSFSKRRMFFDIIVPTFFFSCLAIIFPIVIEYNNTLGWSKFLMVTIISVFCSALAFFFIGLKKTERNYIVKLVLRK